MSIPRDVALLASIFSASGVVHLVRPEVFEPIMPEAVPAPRAVIVASGVAELALAAGLMRRRTRRAAGWGSVALLVGVYPANLKQAKDAVQRRDPVQSTAAIARLPFQWPLVRIAWEAARGRR